MDWEPVYIHDTERGKRGDLIGEVVEQGILWTNVKTGEQQLEHYDLEKK